MVSYAIARLSLAIVVSTCRTRRVVHPPLYSRLFPARRRIEWSFTTRRRWRLTSKAWLGTIVSMLSRTRCKRYAPVLCNTNRPQRGAPAHLSSVPPRHVTSFLPSSLRRTVAAVYVQLRVSGFRPFQHLEHVKGELEKKDLGLLRKVQLLFDSFVTFSTS